MRSTWAVVAVVVVLSVAPMRGGAKDEAPSAPGGGKPASVPPAAAGNAQTPAEPGPEPIMPGQDPSVPPPGTPADQELWTSGVRVSQRVRIERARAARLQVRLMTRRYTERLDMLNARGGDAAARGRASRERLDKAHLSQAAVLNARWPVDTYRVCGYPALDFGTTMGDPKAPPDVVARHRTALVGCVDLAGQSVQVLKEANDAVEAALVEADAILAAAGLGSPTVGIRKAPAAKPAAAESSTERNGSREHGEDRDDPDDKPDKGREQGGAKAKVH